MKPDSVNAHMPSQAHSPDDLMKMSNDALHAIGYERCIVETPDGPMTRVARKGALAENPEKEKDIFEIIEVRVPLAARTFKPLSNNEIGFILRMTDCYDGRFEFCNLYEKNEPAYVFRDDFMRFFLRSINANDDEFWKSVIFENSIITASGALIDAWAQEMSTAIKNRIDEVDLMSAKDAEGVADDMERIKGKFGDPAQWKERRDAIARDILQNSYGTEEKFAAYENRFGDMTYEQFVLTFLKEYLSHVFGKNIFDNNHSVEEMRQTIQSFTPHLMPFVNEEKELRIKIKNATSEERRVLSGQLKSAEEERKKAQQILKGIVQWLSFDARCAEVVAKKTSEIQDNIAAVAGSGKNTEMTLFLDGRYNKALDADPGKVSGDCTEGRPLPFGQFGIPLYNIKCFNDQKRHIGNIYLLETHLEDSKSEKVWHIDAIQIPSRILWKEAIGTVINAIAMEAKKKCISAITVNSEDQYISNYSYISDAVKKYHEATGLGMERIHIPRWERYLLEDEYSQLQGGSETMVVFRNKGQGV